MKQKFRMALVAVASAAITACGPAGIPANAVAVVTPLSLGPPPIYSLLGYRQELELTSDQIAALDSIAQKTQDENRELVEALRKSGDGGSSRSGVLVVMPEGESILSEIRANNRAAGEAIAGILSEEQEATVCELFERADRPRRQEERGDERWLEPTGWPWCTASASEEVVAG